MIPSWVEVSFFGNDLARDSSSTKAANKFLPRCKMYQLQMTGLSESDKSLSMVPLPTMNSSSAPSLIPKGLKGYSSGSSLQAATKRSSRERTRELQDSHVQPSDTAITDQALIDESNKFDQDVFQDRKAWFTETSLMGLEPPSNAESSSFPSLCNRTRVRPWSLLSLSVGFRFTCMWWLRFVSSPPSRLGFSFSSVSFAPSYLDFLKTSTLLVIDF